MLCCNLWERYEIGRDVYREKLLRYLECVLEHLDYMQYDLTPTVHLWDGDHFQTETGKFMHNGRLGVHERLRKELSNVEAAATHKGKQSWVSRSRLLQPKPYRPLHRLQPTLYTRPTTAVTTAVCFQFAQYRNIRT